MECWRERLWEEKNSDLNAEKLICVEELRDEW